jgi:hypothetical protein
LRINSGEDVPNCPQCSQPGLLSALVPHSLLNGRGEEVHGSAVAVLCATCDSDNREAGALITFFAVHGAVSDDTLEEVAPLLEAWARQAKAKPFDPMRLQMEYEAWRQEEL